MISSSTHIHKTYNFIFLCDCIKFNCVYNMSIICLLIDIFTDLLAIVNSASINWYVQVSISGKCWLRVLQVYTQVLLELLRIFFLTWASSEDSPLPHCAADFV